MTKQELKEKAKNWKTIPSRLSQEVKNLIEKLKKEYYWAENNSEIIYCLINDINEFPKCELENCNNKKRFVSLNKGYRRGCGKEHNKILTSRERYGVDNPYQSKEIQEKYKETIRKKYGADYYVQSDEFKKKVDVKEKAKKANKKSKEKNLEKYGVEYPFQRKDIREKAIQTMKEKYGNNPFANPKIKEKIIKTKLEKYGTDHHFKADTIKEKIKETHLKKYGVENPMQSIEIKRKIWKKTYQQKLSALSNVYEFLFNEDEFEGVDKKYRFKCKKCGFEFEESLDNGKIPVCPKCYPKLNGNSKVEIDLFESINYPNKIQSDRTILNGKEINILIPEKKLGIELNGIYWHIETNGKDKNYHLNKTKLAESKGYQLLQFWDIEYLGKRDIVLSLIHSKLGIFEKKIYARKCKVREIDNETSNDFLWSNHLQGGDKSKVRLGLFYNDELVSVMTFSKPRFNKNYEWELVRFASKLNQQIIGGAGKLLNYFIKNYQPKSIITYADRRYSNGNLYRQLGFKYDGFTSPNYFYIKNGCVFSRQQFQKHKLKDKLEFFNPDLTEWENMQLNGYDRIWDCGNYRFILKL